MLMKRIASSWLVLSWLVLLAPAQIPSAPPKLESGKPVEREIAGGQSHTYQISLTSGQFVRVVVEQKGIDLTLALGAAQPEAAGHDGNAVLQQASQRRARVRIHFFHARPSHDQVRV